MINLCQIHMTAKQIVVEPSQIDGQLLDINWTKRTGYKTTENEMTELIYTPIYYIYICLPPP